MIKKNEQPQTYSAHCWTSAVCQLCVCVCGECGNVCVRLCVSLMEGYFPSESTPPLSGEINANKRSGEDRGIEKNDKKGLKM